MYIFIFVCVACVFKLPEVHKCVHVHDCIDVFRIEPFGAYFLFTIKSQSFSVGMAEYTLFWNGRQKLDYNKKSTSTSSHS